MDNPAIPEASMLFEPVKDVYGSRLALVFGNENKEGLCPFYKAKQCNHCDYGAGEGVQFTTEMNVDRLEFFKTHYKDNLEGIEHLIIYNSGSILNKKEMSKETLGTILDYASFLESCKVISLDSREMYVTEDTLDYIVDNLRKDQQVRVILGIESQDDMIRIGKLNKQMTKEKIERAFEVVGKYNGKVGVDVNIVFQPPELSGEEAVKEAVDTLKYGLEQGEKYNVPVDFNFHPFYQSAKSKAVFPQHKGANLEDGMKALVEMKKEVDARASNSKLFVGWQDEGHDQEQSGETDKEIELFSRFNVKQDIAGLTP